MTKSLCVTLAATAATLGSVEQNWTEQREMWNAVQSPYLDIRRTVLGIQPGAPLPGRGLEFSGSFTVLPVNFGTNSIISTEEQDRLYISEISVRQQLTYGRIGYELRAGFVGSDYQLGPGWQHPTDPYVGLNWSIYATRTSGLTLAGGTTLPVPNTENWRDNHGAFGYRGDIRWSASSGMCAITLVGGGAYAPGGANISADAFNIPGTTRTEDTWETDYMEGHVSGMISWRLGRFLRIGSIAQYTARSWDASAEYISATTNTDEIPVSAFMETSWIGGWHLSASYGSELASHGTTAAACITKTLY